MDNTLEKMPPVERRLIEWAKRKRELKGTLGVLLEGEKLITEALNANTKFEMVWISTAVAIIYKSLIERLKNAGCPVSEVSNRAMENISDLETPPGIVAAAHQPLMRFSSSIENWKFIVVLFGAQDPGNVGGVIRTAEYFGADEVWLGPGSVDPYSPKVIRGSMGASLHLPVFRGDIFTRIQKFKAAGAVVWGAVAHGNAEFSIEPAPKRLLLIGSESHGLNERESALADHMIRIPKKGRGESLNLGVAAGILMYSALASKEGAEPSHTKKGKT